MTGSAFKRREFAVKRRRQGGGSGGREPVAPGFHQRLADLSWRRFFGLGAVLERLGAVLARSWAVLGGLGPSWAVLGPSWFGLARSWRGLGAVLGRLGRS